MIYTITLNPCLDRYLEVEDLREDDANRIVLERRYAAGKGVDVSRVTAELGGNSIALGFLGGFDGLELQGRLINEGVQCDFTTISNETRINIQVYNRKTKKMLSINAPGPEVTPAELGQFCQKICNLKPLPTYAVLSGSVPRGVTKSIYNQLGLWLKKQGARVVLDADGEVFTEGLKSEPFLIKPNRHEFARFLGEDLQGKPLSYLAERARLFFEYGVELVVISLGADGLLLISREQSFHIKAPQVEVKSAVGSGDSLVGGLVYGLECGLTPQEAARQGAACGAATALTSGTALCRREDVERLHNEVQISGIS